MCSVGYTMIMSSQFKIEPTVRQRLIYGFLLCNGLCLGLMLLRILAAGNMRYLFMVWNLFLAWVPAAFSLLLVRWMRTKKRRQWEGVLYAIAWLAFLPNSFYILTDFIHLKRTGEVHILFDVVFFFSFVFASYAAGFSSVYVVHRELRKKLDGVTCAVIISGAFLLCGYAVYLGRVLRWNSWDLVTNPAGILFDASDGVIRPLENPQMILITSVFFLLLTATYGTIYELVRAVSEHRNL